MKNDRNINAPISKIVEAIRKVKPIGFNEKLWDNIITEALASLESSEREVLEGLVEWINKTMHPFHFSKEIIDRYLAEKGVKND